MNKEKTLVGKYLESIIPHGEYGYMSIFDTILRMMIGKTDDIRVGKCSHNAILERERDAKGKNPEHYCRCCGICVNEVGIGRCNDFLVIRNRKCRGPICIDCMKTGGDVFYEAFKKGLKKHKLLRLNNNKYIYEL